MSSIETENGEPRYTCHRTQRWLDNGLVREKREFFRVYYENGDQQGRVSRRERVVTFFTQLRGRDRLDNEYWFTTNDPDERDRLRKKLCEQPAGETETLPAPSAETARGSVADGTQARSEE